MCQKSTMAWHMTRLGPNPARHSPQTTAHRPKSIAQLVIVKSFVSWSKRGVAIATAKGPKCNDSYHMHHSVLVSCHTDCDWVWVSSFESSRASSRVSSRSRGRLFQSSSSAKFRLEMHNFIGQRDVYAIAIAIAIVVLSDLESI